MFASMRDHPVSGLFLGGPNHGNFTGIGGLVTVNGVFSRYFHGIFTVVVWVACGTFPTKSLQECKVCTFRAQVSLRQAHLELGFTK